MIVALNAITQYLQIRKVGKFRIAVVRNLVNRL
jgi:hypothetical protein